MTELERAIACVTRARADLTLARPWPMHLSLAHAALGTALEALKSVQREAERQVAA